MYDYLKQEVEQLIAAMKQNPTHILRWRKQEEELKKTPELYLEHKNIYSEEFVFQPEEDIMVYPDFPYIGYPVTDLEEQKKFEQTYFHRHEFFELFYIYEGTCYCYFKL